MYMRVGTYTHHKPNHLPVYRISFFIILYDTFIINSINDHIGLGLGFVLEQKGLVPLFNEIVFYIFNMGLLLIISSKHIVIIMVITIVIFCDMVL